MKVDLFLFSYRAISTVAFMAINRMARYSQEHGVQVEVLPYGNALIHRARNAALGQMRPDSTHVLFCDDDMLPGKEALVKLLECAVPVVSALCTTRQTPIRIAAKVHDAAVDQFVPFDTINLGHAVTGPFAPGTGFLLLDRKTVEQVVEYHLSARDWLDEERRYLDRLRVRMENREKERARKEQIRRANWEREKFSRIFDYPVIANEMQLGEDIAFGRKLLNLKIPVMIDTQTWVGHIGEYAYGINDILERESKLEAALKS